MSAVLKQVIETKDANQQIKDALSTYAEYAKLVDSHNDRLYMFLKTLEAHTEETGQFTLDEVKEAKKAALIQVSAERKFCIQLSNSPMPDDSDHAKLLLPDIEEEIKSVIL